MVGCSEVIMVVFRRCENETNARLRPGQPNEMGQPEQKAEQCEQVDEGAKESHGEPRGEAGAVFGRLSEQLLVVCAAITRGLLSYWCGTATARGLPAFRQQGKRRP